MTYIQSYVTFNGMTADELIDKLESLKEKLSQSSSIE
jgi:hypothetical protein